MCKRLSERGADDLIAFVRKVRREAVAPGWPMATLREIDALAFDVLAKHGLLTPADDPEVAAVFMKEEPQERATDAKPLHCQHCGWGDHGTAYHRPGLHGGGSSHDFNSGEAHLRAFEHRHGIERVVSQRDVTECVEVTEEDGHTTLVWRGRSGSLSRFYYSETKE